MKFSIWYSFIICLGFVNTQALGDQVATGAQADPAAASEVQSCLNECRQYWDKNPDAKPSDTAQVCKSTYESVQEIMSSGKCTDGVSDAVNDVPAVLAAYMAMVPNVAAYLRGKAKDRNDFIDQCDKDVTCKIGLLRTLPENRMRDANGNWKVSDKFLAERAKKANMLLLLADVEAQRSKDVKYCSQISDQIDMEYVNHRAADATAYQQDRDTYLQLAAKDPMCLGVLKRTMPVPHDPRQLGQGWLRSLGIMTECYDPDKMAKLLCYDVMHTALDPINLVPFGFAVKVVKMARLAKGAKAIEAVATANKAKDGAEAALAAGKVARTSLAAVNDTVERQGDLIRILAVDPSSAAKMRSEIADAGNGLSAAQREQKLQELKSAEGAVSEIDKKYGRLLEGFSGEDKSEIYATIKEIEGKGVDPVKIKEEILKSNCAVR